MKTPAELQREADQSMRDTLTNAGVPVHRVAGERLREFRVAEFTDIAAHRSERRSVMRVLYPNTVDRWLAEGGPGFEEQQRRAINHCRALWQRVGSHSSLVANLDSIGGGCNGREHGLEQSEALAALAQYEKRIPRLYWSVFENVVRHDMAAGPAGANMAEQGNARIAHAKNCVGFVASLIAMWRGF